MIAVTADIENMRQGERTDIEPSANLRKVSQSDAAKKLSEAQRDMIAAILETMKQGRPGKVQICMFSCPEELFAKSLD